MVLAFDLRTSTLDVDVFISDGKTELLSLSAKVAENNNWSSDWMNDGVKGFLSENGDLNFFKAYPNSKNPIIKVFVPSLEYLLAMKCMAMRIETNSKDVDDIRNIAGRLGISSAETVIENLKGFYPALRIPQKTFYGIIEIFEADQGDDDDKSPR